MSITIIIIAVTCLVSYLAFNNPELRANLLFIPSAVKNRGETYRFISHGFIHADFMHLLFNMWALYVFGEVAESFFYVTVGSLAGEDNVIDQKIIGNVAYVLFYLSAIAAATWVSYRRHQDNYPYSALGASGAVAALIWPIVLIAPWEPLFFAVIPSLIGAVAYVAYSHYADQRGGTNVGHNAHLWGSIYGLVLFIGLAAAFRMDILEQFVFLLTHPGY